MDTVLYRRPRYLALVLLTIAALGAFAINTVGRQEDPTITNLFATILTPFPGADPARVEALVTEKIEAELREIPEIDVIASTSRTGISAVQVELSQTMPKARIEQAWSEIRDALADAARSFPAGVPEPDFDNDRTGAFTLIASLTARQGVEAPPALLARTSEALQERLRQVPQTKQVRLYGQPQEEIRVTIDPDRLSALGLTPSAVSAAIAAADAKLSAGRIRGGGGDYLIEVAGELDSLARLREVVIATGPDGRVTRVGDIATLRRTEVTPPAELAEAGGRRAVLIAARVEDDRQVDRWASATRAEIATFSQDLPGGLALETVFDQSGYTAERLTEVGINMAVGVALVVAVLFVTMGWRAALVVAAMLPLTSLLSLVVLEKLGVTIHQMSVTGLIVALGLLVDAAIVMTDEIRKRLVAGTERLVAVGQAVHRLAIPLAASTVTTVLAFVPMAALPGPAGDFVGAIALSVIVMLVASLGLALTVAPAIAGRLLAGDDAASARGWWQSGLGGGLLARGFAASLDAALRWRWLALIAAASPAVVGFLAFPTLTAQFFPEVDRDQFHVQIELAEGSAIGATRDAARRAEDILASHPDVEAVQWVIGRSAPAFYYNMMDNRDADPSFAEALVTTASPEATAQAIPALQTTLDATLPEARVLVRGLKQGPPVDAPIELRLVGPGLETLRVLGEEARARIAALPSVTHARATLAGGAPKLLFALDEDKVRLAGLDLATVAQQLEALTEGVLGGSILEGTEELPVRVRLDGPARSSADRLARLTILPAGARDQTASGGFAGVPLLSLGTLRLAPADGVIARRDGERVNTVQGFLEHGVLPDEAFLELQTRLAADPLALPPGYRIEWGGDSDARGETVRNLLSVVGLVVVGTVAAIVLTFNSWRLSVVTFVVAGLSMGLSLLALEIFGYPFGIQALIGVIGAIGVSVNAAIILLTALQEDRAAAAGDPRAIRNVILGSARHITSTTLTTFGGFLPLLLGGGGFWPPFAMSIAGGVLLSAIVSFYFVPPAFSLLVGRSRRAAQGKTANQPMPVQPPTPEMLRLAAE
ncbi:MAG: efflux RND transporter permease subunit [Pseudomonadota bacterium]